MTDLLALAAELVAIPSTSHHEAALADRVEAELRRAPHLEVMRFEDTVVARTELGRARRGGLPGHARPRPGVRRTFLRFRGRGGGAPPQCTGPAGRHPPRPARRRRGGARR